MTVIPSNHHTIDLSVVQVKNGIECFVDSTLEDNNEWRMPSVPATATEVMLPDGPNPPTLTCIVSWIDSKPVALLLPKTKSFQLSIE